MLKTIFYYLLFMSGTITAFTAIVDITCYNLWSNQLLHNYILDGFLFISGGATAFYSLKNIDKP